MLIINREGVFGFSRNSSILLFERWIILGQFSLSVRLFYMIVLELGSSVAIGVLMPLIPLVFLQFLVGVIIWSDVAPIFLDVLKTRVRSLNLIIFQQLS